MTWAPDCATGTASPNAVQRSLSIDHAALHHKANVLQRADVVSGLPERRRYRRNSQASEPRSALPAEQLRAIERACLHRGQRRHPVFHHQFKFARLGAMRKRAHIRSHGHGNSGGELLCEILGVQIEQRRSCEPCSGVAACSAKYSPMAKVGTAKICFSRMNRMVSSLSWIGVVDRGDAGSRGVERAGFAGGVDRDAIADARGFRTAAVSSASVY